jgi:hypothetical protein
VEEVVKTVLSIAATGLLLSSAAAFAQTPSHPVTGVPAQTTAANSQTATANSTTKAGDLRQQMKADLEKAGFADVTLRPDSFLVQAKDKSGDPVAMMITPNSVTEVVDQGSTTSGTSSGPMFAKIPASDRLSSEIVGLDVYNKSKQDIGTIKDIAYAGPDVNAYIVAVGGFLGMGDHYVAVNPSDISVAWDASAKKWHASMDTTADQLRAAPEFKYPAKS